MALPALTVTARLVDAPELRYTPNGVAVAKMRLAANSRRLNKQTNEWEDADVWWGRATAFARTAEAIAEANLSKGELVMLRGRVKTTQWEDKQTGAKRSADEVILDDIARVIQPPRNGAGGGAHRQAPGDDPWAAPPGGGFGGGGGAQQGDEPPF